MGVGTRKLAIGAAALVLTAALVGWFVWVPAQVASKVHDRLADRLGTSVDVTGVRVGLGSISIAQVTTLESPQRALTLTGVEVRGSLWDLAARGSSAVRSVHVEHVDAGFGVSAIAELLSRKPTQSTDGAPPQNPTVRPDITIEGIDLSISDAHGPLFAVQKGSLRSGSVGGELLAQVVRAGANPGEELQLTNVLLHWDTEGGIRFDNGEVGGGRVILASDGDEMAPELALKGRFGAAWRTISEGRATSASSSSATNGESGESNRGVGLLARLSDDFRFQIRQLRVDAKSGNGMLRELFVNLERDGNRLRCDGHGIPGETGKLAWRFQVWPGQLRAVGDLNFSKLPLALVLPFVPRVPFHAAHETMLSGVLKLESQNTLASGEIFATGKVAIEDLGLHSARIAPEPVRGIDVAFAGKATFKPQERRLEVSNARVEMGAAAATVAGAVEWAKEHYLFDLDARLPSTDCATALAAIPADLLADAREFSWGGKIAGSIRALVDSRDLDNASLKIRVADGCNFQKVPALADLRRVLKPFTHRVMEPDGTWFEMEAGPGSENWAPLPLISPFFVHTVLAHEDAGFFSHSGFAPWAIEGALKKNLKAGRYVQGASTITMQLAKNIFLHREKTLARKIQEVLLTWWLETGMGKAGILELYLNVIEYGPRIYGIRNAAKRYFGREPSELSLAEGAFLACILPNPKKYFGMATKGLSESMKRRMKRLLTHMHAKERIDEQALNAAHEEIDNFRFHREGDPPPPGRQLVGTVAPLPYMGGAILDSWDEEFGDDDTLPGLTGPERSSDEATLETP